MIRKITPTGVVTTVAGNGTSGSANGPGSNASFNFPRGIAVDTAGNIFVSDSRNNMIRKIDTTGTVTTVAGTTADGSANGTGSAASFSGPHGMTIDAAGNLFVADAGGLLRKVTPAGEVSTLAGLVSSPGHVDGAIAEATFQYMQGITIDASGILYVIETDRVRKIE
jgi:sugar lactone lactonase YvrE